MWVRVGEEPAGRGRGARKVRDGGQGATGMRGGKHEDRRQGGEGRRGWVEGAELWMEIHHEI